MRRRVVITGIGCVSPLGSNLDQVWSRMVHGQSGIGRTTLFDSARFATRIAAEVEGWSAMELHGGSDRWSRCARHTQFAVGAAQRAVESAQLLDGDLDPTRFGVYLGCGDAHTDFQQFGQMIAGAMQAGRLDLAEFIREGLELLDPVVQLELEPHMPASHVASLFNAQGPHASCFTACAAGSQAIGEAVELIRRGDADVMLAGGTHSLIHPFGVTGLNLLTALSTQNDNPAKASRPFDLDRDGFVLGEGSGMVVVESYEHAQARGATIFGEVSGYGVAADAYRITDTHPDGRGAKSCMKSALDDARLNPEDIGYVNAHGTSTVLNDKIETLAIKSVFGPQAFKTPISSTKGVTGHMLAATGAIELIACLLTLRDQVAPPTINYETPDPECDLDYVPNEARDIDCRHVLSNSFGFGGQNVALVLSSV